MVVEFAGDLGGQGGLCEGVLQLQPPVGLCSAGDSALYATSATRQMANVGARAPHEAPLDQAAHRLAGCAQIANA